MQYLPSAWFDGRDPATFFVIMARDYSMPQPISGIVDSGRLLLRPLDPHEVPHAGALVLCWVGDEEPPAIVTWNPAALDVADVYGLMTRYYSSPA